MAEAAIERPAIDLANAIRWACVLEASAAKLGNVSPEASFADLTYSDFVRSAEAVAPVLARSAEQGVGRAVFESIRATRAVVTSNTNLGIVLLLAPLALVPRTVSLRDGIGKVLRSLTQDDAAWVYRAIRLAQPGGLGSVSDNDVADEPTGTLLEVMQLAADRDGVAAQYAQNFAWVLSEGLSFLREQVDFSYDWNRVIIDLQLRLLANHPDTLIARKCGRVVAEEASRRACELLRTGDMSAAAEFDRWLRAESNRRNPGTTADLVTACLFAGLREGVISPPPGDVCDFSVERLAAARTIRPGT